MCVRTRGFTSEYSNFSCTFFQHNGRLLLAHGTDRNRLDISDPQTGSLLTERGPTSYRRGEERPAHYLDYFHCGLTVSPDNEWIADNGWVWHPFGTITAWSLRGWVTENVWESEDGPTKKALCWRDYYWDGPLCWINSRTLAVWGQGTDEENLFAAVRLFDVVSGEELGWFPGPVGELVFDEYLFSCAPEHGTSVWDVATGERLLHTPEFCPTTYHPGAREFLTWRPDGTLLLSRLEGAEGRSSLPLENHADG
ncbi:MAG: hypothetical protein C4321_08035 [Chloroflexota bacterium]